MTDAAPLLAARSARIAVDGAVALDGLDLDAPGPLVVVGGDAGALFAALSGVPLGLDDAVARARSGEVVPLEGEARVVAGSLTVAGRDVASGAHAEVVGAAPFDAPMPPELTVVEALALGARLRLARRGRPRQADVADAVRDALERAALTGGPKRPIGTLAPAERRILALAQAGVAGASVILADRPLAGLDPQPAAYVHEALRRIVAGRSAIVRVATSAPEAAEGALARAAASVAFLSRGQLVFAGAPGAVDARLLRVTVRRGADELRAALDGIGAAVAGGPSRFSVALPEGLGPTDVLRAAAGVRASVVEIVPLM